MIDSKARAVLANCAEGVFDEAVDQRAAAEFLADSRHHIAVATEDGEVVVFASGVHYFHPDKPVPELFVNEVGVPLRTKGRGVGRAVVTARLQHGGALGCGQAWVLTDRDNTAACAFMRDAVEPRRPPTRSCSVST